MSDSPDIKPGDFVVPAADMPEHGLLRWSLGIVQNVTENGAYEVGFAVEGATAPVYVTLEASELLAMRSGEDVLSRVIDESIHAYLPLMEREEKDPALLYGKEMFSAIAADDCARVAKLLDDGIELSKCIQDDGENPLHAAAFGRLEIVKLLLPHCKPSDLNAMGVWGYTPLAQAVIYGRLDIAELLLAHGADINTIDGPGIPTTPLRQVADKAPLHVLKFLVEHGADWDVPGWMLLTARDIAEERIAGERPLDPDIALDEAAEAEVRAWLVEELARPPRMQSP